MEEKKKILVAVDGSENSDRALLEAKKYAELYNGKITLVTVVKPLSAEDYIYREIPDAEADKSVKGPGEIILEKSLKLFEDSKDDLNAKVRKGNPADEILQESEDGDYDIIIMGNRGLGIFSRSFLGSVSNKVLNHAETDVLVIK